MTNATDISSRALIVNLSISQWSGRKLDRQVTDEVNADHAADADAGRYNKMLVEKTALAPIQSIANAARIYVYRQTLPWGDNGDRVLMSTRYFDFMTQMREFESAFKAAVDKLVGDYKAVVERSRFRLNDMFKEADYPEEHEVENKFRMNINIRPVPTAGDFRVAMGDDVVEEIKAQIEENSQTLLNEAMQTVWQEVKKTITHIQAKLADPKAIFKASTIESIDDLIERIPHLNLTDDPNLEAFRKELKQNLQGLDAKELRKDEFVRSAAAEDAKRIMDQFAGMWG